MRNFNQMNRRGRNGSMEMFEAIGQEIKAPHGGVSFYKLPALCITKPYEYSYQRTHHNHMTRSDTLQERLVYALRYYGLNVPLFTDLVNEYAKDMHSKITFTTVTMYNYCYGKFAPKIDRLNLLAGTLDVPVSWLMGYGERWLPDDFDPDVVKTPRKNGGKYNFNRQNDNKVR